MFDPVQRAKLYSDSAFEHHLIGRVDEAIRAQEAALALHRQNGDALNEGDALRWLSRIFYVAGDRISAERIARESIAHLAAFPQSAELAMAYSNMSQLAMLAEDPDEAIVLGEKAIALADRLKNEPLILAHAYNNIGSAKQWRDPAGARADLERSLRIATVIAVECGGSQEHAARAYTNYAFLEVALRNNRRAHELLEEGITYCVERDLDNWRDYMRGSLAELLSNEGRWDEAAQAALLVVESEGTASLMRYPSVVALARVRMRRGDPEVKPLLDELATFLEKCAEAPRLGAYAVLVAEYAWLTQADSAPALSLLHQAAEAVGRTENPWLIGEVEYWRRKLSPQDKLAPPHNIAEPFRLLFAGNWSAAAQAWQDLHAPYEQALALLEGDEDAQRRALDILDTIGVAATADRVRTALRDQGLRNIARGPRASTRANVAGLTRRQMDVLALIDKGLSNAEIAEKLFVSPKTVDHHVSAILAKLEAASRGEAAAIARDAGLIARKA
jgi:DNA-binding CsgD family transcriptional regulator